ncbi:hypothetical protein Btru_064673 [Bulinus truncatus]|nr:hypothetical protein Btru_064673 [Bulinus truncatus]
MNIFFSKTKKTLDHKGQRWQSEKPRSETENERFWFGVVATNCLTGLSMLTNLANMILFVKQGLRERVNFALFCLSVTDFMTAAFTTSVTVGFHARQPDRQVVLHVRRGDTENNSTIWILDYSELYVTFQIICDFLLGIVLTTSCQIGVFVCAILMYRGLRNTSKIRCPTKVYGQHRDKDKVPTLSRKERRVVNMILALAIAHLLSTTPQTLYCWLRVLVKEMATDENQHLGLVLVIIFVYTTTAYGACSAFRL